MFSHFVSLCGVLCFDNMMRFTVTQFRTPLYFIKLLITFAVVSFITMCILPDDRKYHLEKAHSSKNSTCMITVSKRITLDGHIVIAQRHSCEGTVEVKAGLRQIRP